MWVKWIQAFKEREKVCLRLLRIADRSRLEKVSKSLMPSISPLAPIWPDLTCMGYKRLERSHLPQVRSPHPSRQKGFDASCIKRWRTEARKLRNLRTGSMIPGKKYSGYCWTLSTMMIYLLFIQNTWTKIIEGIVELEQKCSICEDDKHVLQAAASSSGRRRSSVAQSKEFTKLVKDLQEDYAKKVFSFFYSSPRQKVFSFLFFLAFF